MQRVPILRRAAFDNIGNIYIRAVQPNHLQHVVQELTASSHKGDTLLILVLAGSLSNEENLRVLGAVAKDHMGPGFRQPTGPTGHTGLF